LRRAVCGEADERERSESFWKTSRSSTSVVVACLQDGSPTEHSSTSVCSSATSPRLPDASTSSATPFSSSRLPDAQHRLSRLRPRSDGSSKLPQQHPRSRTSSLSRSTDLPPPRTHHLFHPSSQHRLGFCLCLSRSALDEHTGDDGRKHGGEGGEDGAVGVPESSAVLQRAREEGVGDAGGERRDDGQHSQLVERRGVAAGSAVGGEA
jgi:hypothetical protein